MSIKFSYY